MANRRWLWPNRPGHWPELNRQLLDTLAAAYAEAGRFDQAVETAGRALNLPAVQNDPALAETIRARLKLYESHSPYHEKP